MDNASIVRAKSISIISAGFLVFLTLVGNITGCTLARSSVAALKSTAHFVPMEGDKRVFAEPGAEDVAVVVAKDLAEAIATVEREQYRPFVKPVEVYVTRDEESFRRFYGSAEAGNGRRHHQGIPLRQAQERAGTYQEDTDP